MHGTFVNCLLQLVSSSSLSDCQLAGRLILNEVNAIVIDEVDSLLSMSRKDLNRKAFSSLKTWTLNNKSTNFIKFLGVLNISIDFLSFSCF